MEIVEKNETHILYPVHLSISSVVFKVIEEEQHWLFISELVPLCNKYQAIKMC